MKTVEVYGIGGYCADCSDDHDHPLHNVVDIYDVEVPDEGPTVQDLRDTVEAATNVTQVKAALLDVLDRMEKSE